MIFEEYVNELGEGFGFAFKEGVAGFCALELRFHESQRLPGREYRLSLLSNNAEASQ